MFTLGGKSSGGLLRGQLCIIVSPSSVSVPPTLRLSASLAPVSLSRPPMCIDGSGIQEPPAGEEGCAPVPRILCGQPSLFTTTCIQYCQSDCGPRRSLAPRTTREQAARRRETKAERMKRRKGALCLSLTILLPSHLFPSLPSCFCGIMSRLLSAPLQLLIGEVMAGEIQRISLRYHLPEWGNSFEL